MTHQTALFALSLMLCQRRLESSPEQNIGNVFELSDVAFLLAPPGLLVNINSKQTVDLNVMTCLL